jgi:tetratricopeptide (TPR) repeat protein
VTHLALRLFRNRPEYRFEGRIHEQKTRLMPTYLPERFETSTVQVRHYGYLKSRIDAREKSRRNVELLERQLSEQGATAFGAFNLGTEYVLLGEAGRARDYLERAWVLVQSQPGFEHEAYVPLLLSRLASVRRECGDRDAARASVAAGLELYPDHTDLVFELALCAVEEGDDDTAEQHVTRCLELGDAPTAYSGTVGAGTYLALALLGQLRQRAGRPDEAVEIYRRSLAEHPDFVAPVLPLATLLLGRGATATDLDAVVPAQRPSALLLVASACYEAGLVDEACERFARVLERQPENGAARVGLVEALLSQSRWDDAVAEARKRVAGSDVEPLLAHSELFVHALRGDAAALGAALENATLGDADRALFEAWHALLAGNELPAALPADTIAGAATMLGALLRVQEFEAFESLHRLYATIDVEPAARAQLLAAIYFRRGYLDSAADEWIASVQAEPNAPALVGLAQVAIAKGLPDEAVAFLDDALELEPENHEATVLRAAALARAA